MKPRKARKLLSKLQPGALLYVGWLDACSESGWTTPAAVKERLASSPGLPVGTVGFLIAHDRNQVAITHSVTSEGMMADPMFIPLAWVESIEVLA